MLHEYSAANHQIRRPVIAVAVMLVACVMLSRASAVAQEAPDIDADAIPVLAPVADDPLPRLPLIYPALAKPDTSDTVVAFTSHPTINVWSLVVFYWPEIATIVTSLLLVWWMRRCWRRRRHPGEPFCRGCLYSLREHEGERCPECGVTLTDRNRMLGKPRRGVIIVCSVLLLAIIAGYGVGRTRLPRQGTVSELILLRSAWLARWSRDHKTSWLVHTVFHQRFVEIDVESAKIVKAVSTLPGRRIHAEFTLDSDAAVLRHDLDLELFDLVRGERLASVNLAELTNSPLSGGQSSIQWMAMGEQPHLLYVSTSTGEILECDLFDGSFTSLASPQVGTLSRLFYIRGEGRLGLWFAGLEATIQAGGRLEYLGSGDGWRWIEIEIASGSVKWDQRAPDRSAANMVTLSPDGTRIAIIEEWPGKLEVWNRAEGQLMATIAVPVPGLLPRAISADNRWVIAESRSPAGTVVPSSKECYIFDIVAERCVARFTTNGQMPQIVMLPDNRRVVVIDEDPQEQARRLIFDLAPLMTD